MGSRVPKSIELPSLLLLRSLTFLRILTRSDNVTLSELFLRSPSLIWTGCGRLWIWDLCFTIWRGEGGALLVRPLRGGAVVEPDGCVVAHGWQLQAAVLLFQAAERDVLALPLSSSVCFFLSLLSLSSGFSLCTPYLFFSQIPSFVSSFPIFFPSSLYFVSSLSILSILFSFFVPLLCWRWVVFIGQRERGCPYCRPIAAHREQGFIALPRRWVSWPMGVAGRARLPGFPS